MTFETVVDRCAEMLQHRGRLTFGFVKRHFGLDQDAFEDLKTELISGRRVAAIEENVVLVWTGGHPATTSPAERRQITVLFCDAVEAVQLSSRLDPEEYRDVLGAYQSLASEVAKRFDCHVAQTLGDGLLIYAGYPVAHEDDAERAVRVGLGILERVSARNEGIDDADSLDMRVGIHTGIVVVGELESSPRHEELAIGQAPNIASRIQGLAAPNTLVISQATHRLVAHRFVFEDLGGRLLKGVGEPMQIWRVVAPLDHSMTPSVTEPPMPMIGRRSELDLLLRGWHGATQGQGSAILLEGEPGIGKTRLVRALCERITSGPHSILDCHASPHHQNTALQPVSELAARLLSPTSATSDAERLARVEQALEQLPTDVAEGVALLSSEMGLPLPPGRYPPLRTTPDQRRIKLLSLLRDGLLAQAKRSALLLVVEDLQWLDPTTLELLGMLIDALRDAPLLLVMTCRPDFEAPWNGSGAPTRGVLGRMSADDVDRLVKEVAGGSGIEPDVARLIAERTDGIPLFVEELTRTVLDRCGNAESIPTTLQDSLMARLDRLKSAKRVAQHAAVIGRQFDDGLLCEITPQSNESIHRALEILATGGLIHRVQENVWAFKHALIRDAAYASLLKSVRAPIHRHVADHLVIRSAREQENHCELLAHHFTNAGADDKAALYWRRAGTHADAQSAYVEASRHFAAALEALDRSADIDAQDFERRELLLDFCRVSAVVSGWGARKVRDALTTAIDSCDRAGDSQRHFVALSGLRTHHLVLGEIRLAKNISQDLLDLARRESRQQDLCISHSLLGDCLYRLGEFDEAVSELEAGQDLAGSWTGELAYAGEDPRVHNLSHLSIALWMRGQADKALTCSKEALALARGLDDPLSLVYALRFSADLNHRLRAVDTARDHAEHLIVLALAQGNAHAAAVGEILRGWARVAHDPTVEGIDEIRGGLESYRATGAQINMAFFLGLLAESCLRCGAPEEARAAIREARRESGLGEERWWDAELHRLAGVLDEDRDEAEKQLRRALNLARGQGAMALALRAATTLGRRLNEWGRNEEAHEIVQAQLARQREGFNTPDVEDAASFVAL